MTLEKKTLMFELYNLMNPMEWGALKFEIVVQKSSFEIVQLLFLFYFYFLGNLRFF
jgi:hypothetical protein